MDKSPTPLIEGIDSQTMQGGSYIRQPDGAVFRVEGVNLTKQEKAAAPAIIQAHNEAMAVAAAQAETAAKAANEGAEGGNAEGAQATAATGTSSASPSSEQPAGEEPTSRRRNRGE